MPRGTAPGSSLGATAMEAAARLLREKAPRVADAVGGAAEAMLGPENPPVYHAMQAMNAADPMGLAGVGAPMEGAAKAAAMIGAEERAANFAKWFGKSKVVDAEGRPLTVFHAPGGGKPFEKFDPDLIGHSFKGRADSGAGFYFFGNPKRASDWAETYGGKYPTVMPVNLSIQRPFVFDELEGPESLRKRLLELKGWPESTRKYIAEYPELPPDPNMLGASRFSEVLKANGYDGVIRNGARGGFGKPLVGDPMREVVAFSPEQIKSVFNRGTFDPADPDMLKAVAPMPLPRAGNTKKQEEQKAIANALRRKER